MPSREIRNEMQGEGQPEEAANNPFRPGPQLQLSEDIEKHLLSIVREDMAAAKKARNERDYGITAKGERLTFDDWFKRLKDLYNSRREPKTVPWKFSSNRSLRIGTSILDTMHARLLPAIINENLLRWMPGETKDFPKVERVTRLMRWWMWVHTKSQHFFDVWVKLTSGFGGVLVETTWDVAIIDAGSTNTQPVTDEAGQPLTEADGTPSVVQSRNIKRVEKSQSRSFMPDQVYLQANSKDVMNEPVIIEEEILYRDLEKGEAEGQFVNVSTALRERMPVEGMDNTSMPEEEAQRVKDIKLRNKAVKVQHMYLQFDADGDGFAEDVRIIVSLDHNVYLGGVPVNSLTKSGKRPLNYTKFDNRLDRPDENDGEGVLEKVRELADEIDAIFNQLTDANTLGILRPGFYDPAGDLDAPALKLAPNRMTPVTDPQRNIAFPDISVDIQQLIVAIRLVLEFVERLTAASAFVFGKESETVGGSGTATRTNAIMQSAETRFERPAERMRQGAAKIVTQHLDILQLNIPPGLETRIMGEKGEPVFEANELTQDGIASEMDAYLLTDPAQGSKQLDRDLAGMFYSILLQNPLVGTDPAKIYKVTADLLKAWEKDPVEYLGPAPTSDDIDDPQDENTLIIQGDFGRVRAQIAENHLVHIQEHMAMLESPSMQQVPAHLAVQVQTFVLQHIQEHQQMLQLMLALSQQVTGGKGGGIPSDPGSGGGDSETNKGAPNASGSEQAPGALGEALDTQRKGESQATP